MLLPTGLVIVLLAASAARGAAPPPGGNATAWDLVHASAVDWRDREQRRQLAADLVTRVESLRAVIPAQSGRVRERLLAERQALAELGEEAPTRRRSRFYLSREYQQYLGLELLGNALAELKCARDSRAEAVEMTCWARSAAYLLQEERLDLALRILREARMVPRSRDMPVTARDPRVWYAEFGRAILEQLLIPYLEAGLPAGAPP